MVEDNHAHQTQIYIKNPIHGTVLRVSYPISCPISILSNELSGK